MNVLLAVALTLVALAGTAVIATNRPERQAVSLSFFGLVLTVLFAALQAPDVALSQLGVGAAIVPLMVMLAIRTINATHARQLSAGAGDGGEGEGGPGDKRGDEHGDEPAGGKPGERADGART